MQGFAVGRAVDLTRFNGYEDLLRKLEEMFEIEGELCGSTKKWQVVYTDDEDDAMMVGDDPWQLSTQVHVVTLSVFSSFSSPALLQPTYLISFSRSRFSIHLGEPRIMDSLIFQVDVILLSGMKPSIYKSYVIATL